MNINNRHQADAFVRQVAHSVLDEPEWCVLQVTTKSGKVYMSEVVTLDQIRLYFKEDGVRFNKPWTDGKCVYLAIRRGACVSSLV